MMSESLQDMLIRHEGLRLKPYRCSAGKLTIGVGRNLDDVGITYAEAMEMFDHDIARCLNDCTHAFPWFPELDDARKAVLIDMCFNMGIAGLLKFKKFLKSMESNNYDLAAIEMMESLWSKQVPRRALELANIMRGEDAAWRTQTV